MTVVPLLLALASASQHQAPAPAIATVEVLPARAEILVGQTLQLRARALDSAGTAVPNVTIRWFSGGGEGSVDSAGLVRGGYVGQVRVTAVASRQGTSAAVREVVVHVLPQPASRIALSPMPVEVMAGSRFRFEAVVTSPQGDRRQDPVTYRSSDPRVARVESGGQLEALTPGQATITATAGPASTTYAIRVVPNTLRTLTLSPAQTRVRTGDVVRFTAEGTDAGGRPVQGMVPRWALVSSKGVAQIDAAGGFVAETPGTYTVAVMAAGQMAEAVVTVEPRRVGRGIEVVGRVPTAHRTAEVWIHPSGQCAYLSTISDRVYVIDISTIQDPVIVDSMMADARLINDVMTTEDGAFGVFTREGASSRKNGLVIFEASDPCHPTPIAEYTETVSGGVHSSYVHQGYVYLTDDATGSLRMIDIRDPYHPREAARWQTEQTDAGRYIHDVAVTDGLAYLSYWNDGLVILDVGNGIKGGSPENPQFVSQFKYDLNALYARVDQLWGLGARGTHTAWRAGRYVFVGDEVYASRTSTGLEDGNNLTFGRLQVLDVSDLEHPRLVAWYEPTDGGVHNVWVEGDTLYLGNYQGGARVLDISGELKGDLLRQGREISWILTADAKGARPRAPFAWGAVVRDGAIFVPDVNSGLWILRLEPREQITP